MCCNPPVLSPSWSAVIDDISIMLRRISLCGPLIWEAESDG